MNEVTAHAQMNQKAEVRKTQDKIFGAARNFPDLLPFDQFFEFSR